MDKWNKNRVTKKTVIINVNKDGQKYHYDEKSHPGMSPEDFLRSHNIDVSSFENIHEEYSPSYNIDNTSHQTRYNGQVVNTDGYKKKSITITFRDIKVFLFGFIVGIVCLLILRSQFG